MLMSTTVQVRQRCGLRILHFCELHHRGTAESAVVSFEIRTCSWSESKTIALTLHIVLVPRTNCVPAAPNILSSGVNLGMLCRLL